MRWIFINMMFLENRSKVSDALTCDDSPSNGILKYNVNKKLGKFLTNIKIQQMKNSFMIKIFTF